MRYTSNKFLWLLAMMLDGAILVPVPVYADPPATAPTTAPAAATADQPATQPSVPVLVGGKSIGPYDRPRPQPAKPGFVSPMEGVSGGGGDKPADVQIGVGVGPSEGQYKPNASVTTQPAANPPVPPTPAK